MQTSIALFRGINVGGNNILPMKKLVPLLERLGLEEVRTYIQSGNVVFETNADDLSILERRISGAIDSEFGFEPRVLLVTGEEFKRAIETNPFPNATSEPKSLHFFFLAEPPPAPDLAGLESLRAEDEAFQIIGSVLYLHAPIGVGKSKLAAKIERLVGVPVTARNWRTVSKIAELSGVSR